MVCFTRLCSLKSDSVTFLVGAPCTVCVSLDFDDYMYVDAIPWSVAITDPSLISVWSLGIGSGADRDIKKISCPVDSCV